MTKRILGLLWRISLAPQVPMALDMTICFADVLRDYALTSKSQDTRDLALDYVSQLVQEVSGTDKALPAMRVLSHLIANAGNQAVRHCLPSGVVCRCTSTVLKRVLPDSNAQARQHYVNGYYSRLKAHAES